MITISQPEGMRQNECWRLIAECPVWGFTKSESISCSYWRTKKEANAARDNLNLSGCGGYECTPAGHKVLPPKGKK